MAEHHSFGKACRARRVLHVDDFIRIEVRLRALELFHRDPAAQVRDFAVAQHAGLRIAAYVDHLLQKREALRAEMPRPRPGQFGYYFADRLSIVDFSGTGDEEQRAGFRLPEQVFHLIAPQRRVYRHKNGANLGESELEYDPFRNICCPKRHPVALFDSGCHQPAGQLDRLPL